MIVISVLSDKRVAPASWLIGATSVLAMWSFLYDVLFPVVIIWTATLFVLVLWCLGRSAFGRPVHSDSSSSLQPPHRSKQRWPKAILTGGVGYFIGCMTLIIALVVGKAFFD